ncbi:DNA polymerase III subunit epsilon-like [Mya arenaria]|uniref:DNA polymerase III subunit epsilon-like n=1 Tax=Mya arenaria TaxID=6604 RepID=UPI0022E62D69|nr:DNA polymerase III subunit epsilon-like [Mya arenaria]
MYLVDNCSNTDKAKGIAQPKQRKRTDQKRKRLGSDSPTKTEEKEKPKTDDTCEEVQPKRRKKMHRKRTRPGDDNPTILTFDLETTGLIENGDNMPHITQIAAMEKLSGSRFCKYVKPKKRLTNDAERITGIVMTNANTMLVKGKKVEAVGIRVAIGELCEWLEQFPNVSLVAHYGRGFDFRVVKSAIESIGMKDRLYKCVCTLVDSLPIFRKMYPGQSHKLADLVLSLLGTKYNEHDASDDVEALSKLLSHVDLYRKEILKYSFNFSDI